MTDEDKFLNGLDNLAKLYKTEICEWSLEAYLHCFRQAGFDKGMEALKVAFMKARGGFMPSPVDLLEMVGIKAPEAPKARDHATEIAAGIVSAMTRFGGYRAVEAKAALGDASWAVVEGFGGWENICMTNLDDLGTLRAQLRDLAEAKEKINYHRASDQALIGSRGRAGEIQGIINQLSESKGLQ